MKKKHNVKVTSRECRNNTERMIRRFLKKVKKERIIEEIRDEVNGEELGLNSNFIRDRIREIFAINTSPTTLPVVSEQQATLPQSNVIGTPIATDIFQNQNVGQKLLGSDILRQIEIAKLQGR